MVAHSESRPGDGHRQFLGMSPMALLRSRLAKRLTMVVFIAILFVEIVIFLPSYQRSQEHLLEELVLLGEQWIQAEFDIFEATGDADAYLYAIIASDVVEGVAMFSADGALLGVAGEDLTLINGAIPGEGDPREWRSDDGSRYEIFLPTSAIGHRHPMVLRLDSSNVDAELTAFFWRIAGLTLVISAVLTIATLLAMGSMVLRPLMTLRGILAEGGTPDLSGIPSADMNRRDEIGDVLRTTQTLLADLAKHREDMGRQVLERTWELTETNSRLRESESKMRASEARIRAIMDNSPSFIYLKSVDGRYLLVNKHVEDALGLPAAEIVGKTNADFYSPELAESYSEQDRDVIKHKTTVAKEIEVPYADGGSRTCIIYKFPIFGPLDAVDSIGAIIVDIDDRKQAENLLREAKDQAENEAQSRADLVAMVSHEIRTPMNGVLGMARLLQDMKMDSEQREMVETIVESGDTLVRIVSDLLDVSKIEANRFQLEKSPFIIADIVEQSATVMLSKAREKGLELKVEIDPDIPGVVVGDPLRLRQVLMNLISNAIRYTQQGSVRIVMTEESRTEDAVRLTIAVIDTGAGISQEDQDRLFTPYTQGNIDVAKKSGGTGLGLAICSKLIVHMGSRIELQSALGKGSSFRFTLNFPIDHDTPAYTLRNKAHKPAEPNGLAQLQNAEPLTILQVEDNVVNQRVLDVALARQGHTVVNVPNGAEALAALKERTFDLVVMDRHMPVMNGIEATRIIRAMPAPLCDIPIIGVTAGAIEAELDACQRAGMDIVLTKPVDNGELVWAVRNLTGGGVDALKIPDDKPVLVIDDVLLNRTVARQQLDRLGVPVSLAEGGRQGLEQLTATEFGLVLVDISMPEMDGMAFTRAVREREKDSGTHVPIIAMTGMVGSAERERFLASGMNDCIAKPVILEDLAEILSRWLNGAIEQAAVQAPEADVATPTADREDTKRAEAEDSPIDLALLGEILGDDDEAELLHWVGVFIDSFPPLMERIEAAEVAQQRDAMRDSAHAAKSAASSAAATPLADVLGSLEKRAANDEWSDLSTLISTVQQQFDRVVVFDRMRKDAM